MEQHDFLMDMHSSTERDYVGRVVEYDKGECARVAKQYGEEYWDGDRKYGYGGYYYDGRWYPLAEQLAEHYGIESGDKILDVGCGKGYLLYEFTQAVPGIEVQGLDISQYAIDNAKEEVKDKLDQGHAKDLPYDDNEFDFVFSNTTLHNLKINDLFSAVSEIERVGNDDKYICVESYRNEDEKANLLYWQLTCEAFFSPEEWVWIYEQNGYTGDYGFIYFE